MKKCFKCWDFNHTAADCNDPNRTKSCYRCGEKGHNKNDCQAEEPVRFSTWESCMKNIIILFVSSITDVMIKIITKIAADEGTLRSAEEASKDEGNDFASSHQQSGSDKQHSNSNTY